jgi:hypothetical protein
VPALTTFTQSLELASLKIGNARGWPLLFVLYLFIFSCIFGFLGQRIVFFWICFIYVFKIGDWPPIDEHRTPSLFSSISLDITIVCNDSYKWGIAKAIVDSICVPSACHEYTEAALTHAM